MSFDVHELSAFYASPLGETSRRLIGRVLRARWENCSGLSLMGLGYLRPLSRPLPRRGDAHARPAACRPGRDAVAAGTGARPPRWWSATCCRCPTQRRPRAGGSWVETADNPGAVLEEICRVLAPEGRAILVAPSRRGVWARVDGTPFGQGQPYSKGQLRDLMREALFSPIFWGEALYAPPFRRRFFVNSAPAIERLGAAIGLPFAGVASSWRRPIKVYRPVGVRRLGAARSDGAAARACAGRPSPGGGKPLTKRRNAGSAICDCRGRGIGVILTPRFPPWRHDSCRNRNVCSCSCATARASGI